MPIAPDRIAKIDYFAATGLAQAAISELQLQTSQGRLSLMKKWLIALAVILLLSIIGIYIFIPSELRITHITGVKSTAGGAHRSLSDKTKWKNWWTGQAKTGDTFLYNGNAFTVTQMLPHGAGVTIKQPHRTIESRVIVIPVHADSIALLWQCSFPSGSNPFTRVTHYRQAVKLKQDFASILGTLKAFIEKTENVYGFQIQQTSTTDTMLIATRSTATTYPSVDEIYKHINQLKSYAATQGAQQTGYPMLNITQTATNQFQFQLALPVNRQLPDQGSFFSRRMVPGNFLMTEVKGGLHTIDQALKQLQQHARDHQRPSMAIPFQLLVTDRLKEQDTAKWVTRVYYPVM